MAKTPYASVDDYIASFPAGTQEVLRTVRGVIRDAVPEAEETISYNIPAYRSHGWLLYFSGFKNHYSLATPPPSGMWEQFESELAPYKKSKSTVQLPLSQPVPVELIASIARYRAKENLEREAPKPRR